MKYSDATGEQLRALLRRSDIGEPAKGRIREEIARRALSILGVRAPRTFVAPVTPCGKPRMTSQDRWKKRPRVVRYRQFADALRKWADEEGFTPPDAGLSMTFLLPMPASWSKKKRAAMDGQPHQQKPDKDNLEKAVWDAFLDDDSRVWHTRSIEKRWARTGAIIFTIEPLDEQAAA